MKKFLVVLLILSVMGGAFAQQSNWGAISGEAELSTTLDFAHKEIKNSDIFGNFGGKLVVKWEKTWDNAELGAWTITLPLRASQGYFGTDHDDGAKNMKKTFANVKYVLNDLTVTLPFWFATSPGGEAYTKADKDNGSITNSGAGSGNPNTLLGIPAMEGNLDANADWAGDLWGFKFGVADLYTSPTISHTGGYYHFMNGRSQLYVSRDSYKRDDFNVYETNWWRVSDYVLNPSLSSHESAGAYFFGDGKLTNLAAWGMLKYTDLFKHLGYKQYDFHWENINDNGIAYRFFLIPDTLNVGLAFVSSGAGYIPNAGTAKDAYLGFGNEWIKSGNNTGPFFPRTPSHEDQDATPPTAVPGGKEDFNLVDDFLRHPVLGVSYDNKTLGVSAMVGLEPWDGAPENTDVYIHAGAYYKLFNDQIKVNGDISAMFSTGDNTTAYGYGPEHLDPNFNFGVEVSYTNEEFVYPIFAGFGFKMLDLINKEYAVFGTDFIFGFGGAVRDGYKYKDIGITDYDFGDSKAGPIIALRGHVNGLLWRNGDAKLKDVMTKNIFNIGIDLMAGWKEFVLIKAPSEQKAPELSLTVGASLGLDFWFGPGSEQNPVSSLVAGDFIGNHMKTSFSVYPSVNWQVWNNGKITFAYNLGSTDITRAKDGNLGTTLDINFFKTAFKWNL